MRNNTSSKKPFALHRETLRTLRGYELGAAMGGLPTLGDMHTLTRTLQPQPQPHPHPHPNPQPNTSIASAVGAC